MISSEVIYLTIDTNLLYSSGRTGCDLSTFKLNQTFSNIEEAIERNGLTGKVVILIPSIVFEELKKQQIDNYYQKTSDILKAAKDFERIPEFLLHVPEIKYEELITGEIHNFLTKVSVESIEIPLDTEIFKQIISRAIQKKAPFCGSDSNSDKGFKDVLLWESLVSHAHNKSGRYVLLSKNKRDFPESLAIEFFSRTMSVIEFYYDEESLMSKLMEIAGDALTSEYDYVINELDNGEYIENLYIEIKRKLLSLSSENKFHKEEDKDEYEVQEYILDSARENLHEVEPGLFHFEMVFQAIMLDRNDMRIERKVAFMVEAKIIDETLKCKILDYRFI